MLQRPVAALALLIPSLSLAVPLASFEGAVEGSLAGGRVVVGSELDVHPVDGDAMLRLGGGGPSRWVLPVEVVEPSVVNFYLDFVAGAGASFEITIDGARVMSGDATAIRFASAPALAVPAAGPTGWLPFVRGVDARLDAGMHEIAVTFTPALDESAPGALFLDAVAITPQVATPCRPAPYEDSGETPESTASPQTRWTFDDNKFCPAGPGVGCALATDPRPGTDFIDSTGIAFEMYVLADCGTQMHIPFSDVESGCISVFKDNGPAPRDPVAITVSNGVGFNQTGGEVCWSAVDCNPPANNPGGPGDTTIMDVSFAGSPALCGVYVIRFRNWAGCIWDLFANCDGTGTAHFNIYDDICAARAAVNALPEVVVENLTTSDTGACEVGYCATIRNLGCAATPPLAIHVENEVESEDQFVPSIDAGASAEVCGSLAVAGTGTTQVTAHADFVGAVAECSETPGASSCAPAVGANSQTRTQDIQCNRAPTCAGGGPHVSSCREASVDGATVDDQDGDAITFAWTSDRADVTLSPAGGLVAAGAGVRAIPGVVATLDAGTAPCGVVANLTLTVDDGRGGVSSCGATVVFDDTDAPVIESAAGGPTACLWPPNHWYVPVAIGDLDVVVRDGCTTTLRVVGCVSDQPDDAPDGTGWNGDGHTTGDCVVSADGTTLIVRSERCGTGPSAQAGRHYGIQVVAVDACGRESAPVVVGSVHVPHDQSPHETGCLDPTKVGFKD